MFCMQKHKIYRKSDDSVPIYNNTKNTIFARLKNIDNFYFVCILRKCCERSLATYLCSFLLLEIYYVFTVRMQQGKASVQEYLDYFRERFLGVSFETLEKFARKIRKQILTFARACIELSQKCMPVVSLT